MLTKNEKARLNFSLKEKAEQIRSDFPVQIYEQKVPWQYELANSLGIKVHEADINGTDGKLIFFNSKPEIIINKNQYFARKNFTCAHEISHYIYLKEFQENEKMTFLKKVGKSELERIMQKFASYLLITDKEAKIYSITLDKNFSFYMLEKCAELHTVSLDALFRRFSYSNIYLPSPDRFVLLIMKTLNPLNPSKKTGMKWRIVGTIRSENVFPPLYIGIERLGIEIENLQFGDKFTKTLLTEIRIKNGSMWSSFGESFLSQFNEHGRHAIIGFFKLSKDEKIEESDFHVDEHACIL